MLGKSIAQGACVSRRGLVRVFAATGCVTLSGCFPGQGIGGSGQLESPVLSVLYEPPVGQAVPLRVPLPLSVFSFAGGGSSEWSGEMAQASDVRFSDIGGVAVGPDGTVYIAGAMANRVDRVRLDLSL